MTGVHSPLITAFIKLSSPLQSMLCNAIINSDGDTGLILTLPSPIKGTYHVTVT